MHCQLDEVKVILDTAAEARKAVLRELSEKGDPAGLSLMSSSLVFGLLLLRGYDVFIQKGVISIRGEDQDHFWVLVYLDGESFILDVAPTHFPDVLFMPEDEAAAEYGYAMGKDYRWRRGDCEENVWQAALDALGIKKPLSRVFREIED